MTQILYEPDPKQPGYTAIGIISDTADRVQKEIDIIMRRAELMHGKSCKSEFTWPQQRGEKFIALGYVEILQ